MTKIFLQLFCLGILCIPIGAVGQVTATFSVDMPENPLEVDAGPNQIYDGESTVILGGDPTAMGGNGEYTYEWVPSEYLDNPTLANPTMINLDGPMTFTLTVHDPGALCEKQAEVFVDYTLSSTKSPKPDVGVFPNPFNEMVRLSSDRAITELMVTDMTGKTLLVERNLQVTKYQIETTEFISGLYFFVIRFSDGSTSVQKLCKIN